MIIKDILKLKMQYYNIHYNYMFIMYGLDLNKLITIINLFKKLQIPFIYSSKLKFNSRNKILNLKGPYLLIYTNELNFISSFENISLICWRGYFINYSFQFFKLAKFYSINFLQIYFYFLQILKSLYFFILYIKFILLQQINILSLNLKKLC